MELRTSFVKTFQRFSIPRSKSSIGSFPTSMNEQIEDDASASKRRHPPLSYNQHIRSMATSSVRATSIVDKIDSLTSQSTNIDHLKNESQITRDLTLNSRTEITSDNPQINEGTSMNHSRTSLKSFFVKKFQPSSNSSSNIEMHSNNQTKQKKRRTSFRQISQILKRSHSAHGDLTTNVVKQNQEDTVLYDNDSSPRLLTVPLRTISEEENGIQQKQNQQQQRETANQLELNSSHNHGKSSSPSISNRSSTSNKLSSATNSSTTRPDDGNSKSKTSRPLSTYQQKEHKHYLTNSVSLHTSVNQFSNLNDSQLKSSSEHLAIHPTRSYTTNDYENNQTAAVKLRERTSKKKKLMRDLKPRISLPPEIKNNISQTSTMSNFDSEHHFNKPLGQTSNYRLNSRSTQALNQSFNQSIPSLNALSNGHLSRLEYRRSMLDLGWGKLESYVKLEKLGEGTYATVYKGTSNLRSGFVALKEIRLEQEEGAPCTALREVSLLKGLKHNNIVCLYDIIFDRTTLTLVFEYVERDLKRYMDDCENLMSMKNVRLFLFQLLRGLEFCHSKKILHRDLKPQNLLINERGELKLADFGLARIKSFPTKNYSNEVVTLWYRPPDVLLGSTEYSTPIDIWAVGCIFYEMVQGRPLFAGSKVDEELKIIFKCLGTPNETTMPGVTSNPDFLALELPRYSGDAFPRSLSHLDAIGIVLLMKFLRYNPSERISAYDAMHHEFFSSYPKEIYQLKPEQSVLVLNELCLQKDPGSRFSATALMKTAISKRSSVHL